MHSLVLPLSTLFYLMIKIHVLHTGTVRVSPYLPFGGENSNLLKASGFTTPKKDWVWLPVSCYLIEHPKGKVLLDTGWHRSISPQGVFDKKAQIKSLGSRLLYHINQAQLDLGQSIDEQLASLGIQPADLSYVLLSHLDCDHAHGLKAVADAREILVSPEELAEASKRGLMSRMRYQPSWWEGTKLRAFAWNGTEGPVGHSFDLFGDGSLVLIHIPGHSAGLCALRVRNEAGKYVLLYTDGGYATKSWQEMILPGIAWDKTLVRRSLEWISEQCSSPDCIECLATHDAAVNPHVIEL